MEIATFRFIVMAFWFLIMLFPLVNEDGAECDFFKFMIYTWPFCVLPWWIAGMSQNNDFEGGFFTYFYHYFFGSGFFGFLLGVIPCFVCLMFVGGICVNVVLLILCKMGLVDKNILD